MSEPRVGLSKADLEYEVGWALRRMPADPAKLTGFLTDLMVALIDKNNAALARSLAPGASDDEPEEF